jgi:hypothetical protein
MDYNTTGSIGSQGITGNPVVSFRGVEDGSLTTGNRFALGQLVINPLPDGVRTDYRDTPFEIQFSAKTIDGVVPSVNETPNVLHGFLSGWVVGSDYSNLRASFIPDPYPSTTNPGGPLPLDYHAPFRIESLTVALWPEPLSSSLNPSGSNDGRMTLQGTLSVYATPEPTSIVVFSLFATGFLIHRTYRRECDRVKFKRPRP